MEFGEQRTLTQMSERRTQIDQWIEQGAVTEAWAELSELLAAEGLSNATAAFSVARYAKLRPHLSLVSYRVAILRSFTVEPVVPMLRAAGFANGLDLTVYTGEFNAYAQEILDGDSALYSFAPQAVILAVETRSLAPELWSDYGDSGPDGGRAVVARVSQQYSDWIKAFRRHSDAHLILHTLAPPLYPSLGVYDGQGGSGQTRALEEINREIRSLAQDHRGVHTLDYPALVARHGQQSWYDERKWTTVRLPIAAAHLPQIAREWLRYLHPLSGRIAKVVVVDLDNTLWGGVVGEDGLTGIRLDGEHPGAAYRALQSSLKDLTGRGILLAIASKNNPADALEVLEQHPGMLLRPGNFSAIRINWNDKTESLREIAAELNVGVDALAFLDDNPVERRRVRTELQEVMVIDLPEDPWQYAAQVRDCPFFERLTLSEEDRHRSEYYAADRQRAALETTCVTREDFLRSLEQIVEITPANASTLGRVAQLTQKTNQFNLTTRRYSEHQIAELARHPDCQVLSIRVMDRYSDNGVVGVAIARFQGETCEVDTFLLSCRVIGRGVETALLAHLAGLARQRGQTRLAGWFLPTKKNAPAREFYASHGFELVREEPQGTRWAIDLDTRSPAWPDWIERQAPAEVTT
jgi:FkbH-like protein